MSDPKWLEIARKELGVVEPEAEKYFTATDYGPAGPTTPYCAAFVNWVLHKAGFKSVVLPKDKGTGHADAIGFARWGKDVSKDKPVGAVVVFTWSSGGHHVSLYVGGGKFLGGNQTGEHKVCIEALPVGRAIAWRWPA